MSQGPMSNSPSKGGTMRSQAPTSYQSPFGNQNYRTQTSPSKGGQPSFGGPAYQQPGQFGGQIMNRPMQSPGGKGGQSRPPLEIQPYPMPSPGGKGGSYQRPPTPFGYGQPTFAPQQFSGYGQPSNIFSFNNPHYQPYMPSTYGSGQTGQSPDIGNNPMTPQPEVMAQPVDQSAAMREQIKNLGQEGIQSGAVTRDMLIQAGYSNPDQILGGVSGNQSAVQVEPTPQQVINPMPAGSQDRIVDPKTAFTPPGGYNPTMPFFGGKGGTRTAGGGIMSRYMPPEGYSRQMPEDYYNPDELRVIDPYGPGGPLEGRPRPTFPDPTQPQGPQGTVQGAPMNMPNLGGKGGGARIEQAPIQYGSMIPTRDPGIDVNQQALTNKLMADEQAAQSRFPIEHLISLEPPSSGQGYRQQTTGAMNSGLGSLFNSQQLTQRLQGAIGEPRLAPSDGPANPYAMGGSRNGQINYDQVARDRAAYAANRGGYNIAGQYDPNMPPGYGTTYQTLI